MKFTIALASIGLIAGLIRVLTWDSNTDGLVLLVLGAGGWAVYRCACAVDALRAR